MKQSVQWSDFSPALLGRLGAGERGWLSLVMVGALREVQQFAVGGGGL